MDDRLTGNMQEQAESFAATAKGLDERLSRDVQVRRRALQRGNRVDSSACRAETSFFVCRKTMPVFAKCPR